MKQSCGPLAILAFFLTVTDGSAQVLPPGPVQPVVVSGSGFDFLYARRNLVVVGSVGPRIYTPLYPYYGPAPGPFVPYPVYPYPVAPFGIQQNRITIQYLSPQPVVVGGYRKDPTEGIDLDAQPAKKPQPKMELPEEPPPPEPNPEPPAELPGVDVSKPKPALRPEDLPAKPKEKVSSEEATRMKQGGIQAFQEGRYGLASLRFVQAVELDKADGVSRFLLAQSQLALGKYTEAAATIKEGLTVRKNWPTSGFQPRFELYAGSEAEFDKQLKRLAEIHKSQPHDATFTFVLAYQLWFDGRRPEAVELFRRARPQTPDPTAIDLFLKAAEPVAVAAQ